MTAIPSPVTGEDNSAIVRDMTSILQEKREMHDTAIAWNLPRYIKDGVFLVGGDVFNGLYAALQVVVGLNKLFHFFSSSASIVVGNVIAACGFIGGFINIGVGFICIKESIIAFSKKNNPVGLRLLVTGVMITLIGSVMVLSALGVVCTAFAGITAFFASQPWLMPTLFFLASVLTIRETIGRSVGIFKDNDAISKFGIRNGDENVIVKSVQEYVEKSPEDILREGLKDFNATMERATSLILDKEEMQRFNGLFKFDMNAADLKATLDIKLKSLDDAFDEHKQGLSFMKRPYASYLFSQYKNALQMIANEYTDFGADRFSQLSSKLDKMENSMGFYLANILFNETARHMRSSVPLSEGSPVTLPEGHEYEGKTIKKEAKDWDRVQYARCSQQFIYMIGFILIMLGLLLGPVGAIICGILSSLSVFIANSVIALPLDSLRPFTRNTELQIPSVKAADKEGFKV